MAYLKYYRQKSVKGGRKAISSAVLKEIEYEVEHAAKKFKVSKSFVVATALKIFFKIEEGEDFRKIKR